MPLIKKVERPEPVNRRIRVSGETWAEIEQYLAYANLGDDVDLFFEEAAKMVLKRDKGFAAYKKEQAKRQKEAEQAAS